MNSKTKALVSFMTGLALSISIMFSSTVINVEAGTVVEKLKEVEKTEEINPIEAKSVVIQKIFEHEKVVEEEIVEEDVPSYLNIDIPTDTYAKTYEDGRLITCPSAPAYYWTNQCTVAENGHYKYGDYYAVAMGNYFSEVGSKYRITLDTGKTINVIKCDVKQDQHTINRMIDGSGAMIEFIINTDVAGSYYGYGSNGYVLNGNFNNYEEFNGNIVKVELVQE